MDLDVNFPVGRSLNICCLEHCLSFKNENYIRNYLTAFLRNWFIFCLTCFNHMLKISLVLNWPNPIVITDK